MDKEEIKEKICLMLSEAQDSYNISWTQKDTYTKLEARIKALEDVLALFD